MKSFPHFTVTITITTTDTIRSVGFHVVSADPGRLCMYSSSQHPLHAGVLWASRQWGAAEQLYRTMLYGVNAR